MHSEGALDLIMLISERRMLLRNVRLSAILCVIVVAGCSSSGKKAIPSDIPVHYNLPFVRNSPRNTGVIIFVHGVIGDAERTWSSGNQYWPDMLQNDPV